MPEKSNGSKSIDENQSIEVMHHLKREIWSYSSMFLGISTVSMLVISRLIYFYQVAVGLAIWMITIGYVIYTLWDAMNDPIIGHLSDRTNRFTLKWGKRYPWMLFSALPLFIVIVLVFTPPDITVAQGLATFVWFVVMLLIFDTLFSAFTVNYSAQLPHKYRRIDERTKISSFSIIFQILGTLTGFILPLFFFTDPLASNTSEYLPVAIIAGGIFVIMTIAARPGLRENQMMIQTYFREDVKQEPFSEEFRKNIRIAFQQKSYLLVLLVVIAINIANLLTIPMIPYFVTFVIDGVDRNYYEMILWILYMAGGAIMIPVGYLSCNRYGNYNVWKTSLILTGISYLGLFFVNGDAFLSLICVAIIGGVISLANISYFVSLADFYDEVAVIHRKRQEGIYTGLIVVFARLARIISLVIIAIIQTITFFDPFAPHQQPLAQLGILFTLTVIPSIVFIFAGLIIWKFWKLTPDTVAGIKTKLKEMGI